MLCSVVQNGGGSTTARAVALVAGEGTGLFSLPEEIPDPTAPVVGAPVIRRIFDLLAPQRNEGCRKLSLTRRRAAGACGEEASPWEAAPQYAGWPPEPITVV